MQMEKLTVCFYISPGMWIDGRDDISFVNYNWASKPIGTFSDQNVSLHFYKTGMLELDFHRETLKEFYGNDTFELTYLAIRYVNIFSLLFQSEMHKKGDASFLHKIYDQKDIGLGLYDKNGGGPSGGAYNLEFYKHHILRANTFWGLNILTKKKVKQLFPLLLPVYDQVKSAWELFSSMQDKAHLNLLIQNQEVIRSCTSFLDVKSECIEAVWRQFLKVYRTPFLVEWLFDLNAASALFCQKQHYHHALSLYWLVIEKYIDKKWETFLAENKLTAYGKEHKKSTSPSDYGTVSSQAVVLFESSVLSQEIKNDFYEIKECRKKIIHNSWTFSSYSEGYEACKKAAGLTEKLIAEFIPAFQLPIYHSFTG